MSYHRRAFTPQATGAEIERLVFYMPTVASLAENTWARGFAQSITRQCHRRGWKPSQKQLSVMRGLVSDLFTHAPDPDQEDEIQLIE